MVLSLVIVALVGQGDGFLGVTPPSGYLDVTSEDVTTGKIWSRGTDPRDERIGVLFDTATEASPRDYERKHLFAPGEVFVSGRNVRICGRPGYEAHTAYSVDGVARVNTSLIMTTRAYTISASYQRPANVPEDARSIAAIHKLCPPGSTRT